MRRLGHAIPAILRLDGDPMLRIALPFGRLLPEGWINAGHASVALPAGIEQIALRLRAASRCKVEGPFVDDRRRLGVAISGAVLADADSLVALDLDRAIASGKTTWCWYR